jgi:prepilin-type N-terminal cleavage/methylation domain-containing protein
MPISNPSVSQGGREGVRSAMQSLARRYLPAWSRHMAPRKVNAARSTPPSCESYERVSDTHQQAGYSLLEVLIAIAILALAIALSIPSMAALLERHQARQAFAAVNVWLTDQRTLARTSGAMMMWADGDSPARAADLPQGWSASFLGPAQIYPSGACASMRIQILSPRQRVWERAVAPDQCRVTYRIESD